MPVKKIRPVGNGMSWSTGVFSTQARTTFLPTQSYRSLTGRFGFFRIPGSKLPGYLHFVPSGQKPFLRPVHKIDSTSTFEHEHEHEHERRNAERRAPNAQLWGAIFRRIR